MHSSNSKVYIGSETIMIVNDLFKSFLNKYQYVLKTKMTKSSLTYVHVRVFYYKLHKISTNRTGGSYIDPPEWLKNKKAIINAKNKNDNKCLQYALITALNYQQIKSNPERTSKLKRFFNRYDWKDINFPSHKKDWNNFEKK